MFNHPELVEYLIAEGADINALGKIYNGQRHLGIKHFVQELI